MYANGCNNDFDGLGAALLVVVYAMAQRERPGTGFVALVTVLCAFLWGSRNADEVEASWREPARAHDDS